MYKKQEILQLKKEFWTSFGLYMAPIRSAEGEKVNWVNYKTGARDVYFRMDASNRGASIGIEIGHRDIDHQKESYKRLCQFRDLLEVIMNEKWEWELYKKDEHDRLISTVSKSIQEVNILDRRTWPALISFLKPRIIGLDKFWTEVKDFMIDQ